MAFRMLIPLSAALALIACERPAPPLPPLLQGATTTGGTFDPCGRGGSPGSTPETAAHSPEIVERLRRDFPAGTSAARLRDSLSRQGFTIRDCPLDRSVAWAEFRQHGGNGITAMAAMGTVFWKQDRAGRLVWTTGDIAFSGV
jgi:hypothetical protein